jgi:hypothetical protein
MHTASESITEQVTRGNYVMILLHRPAKTCKAN